MIEQDTIKLLRECDAGVKMGVSSIDDVLNYVHNENLKHYLTDCKIKHDKLDTEIQNELDRYKDEGKNPNPMAKGMSWMKTNLKLVMNESDHTIADLITDGCNMGVKSLNKYLNQYKAADEKSKDIAKRLINLEERLAIDIRKFLQHDPECQYKTFGQTVEKLEFRLWNSGFDIFFVLYSKQKRPYTPIFYRSIWAFRNHSMDINLFFNLSP